MSPEETLTHRIDLAGWVMTGGVQQVAGSGGAVATPTCEGGAAAAQRGILAAVTHDASLTAGEPVGKSTVPDVVLTGLIDGYYHARPTFGRGQALAHAAEALNRWMFASHGQDAMEAGLCASLSAAVFSGSRVGLLQIGAGLILRARGEEIIRLTSPQVLRSGNGALAPRRALGNDGRILLDYQEDTALAGDRYILLSDVRSPDGGLIDLADLLAICRAGRDHPAETLARALGCFTRADAEAVPTVARRSTVVLDITSLPEPTIAATEASLAELPLGPLPQDGDVLDGYRIGRTLHRGAYTLLKYAVDGRTREAVALKFPLPAMLNDRVFLAGFARESWIGTSIRSSVVGRIIPPEPGRRSQLYIAMPYYGGETLESRIAREPNFAVAEIVAIGLQLAQAVEDLRAVQVLHRDLKPDNVMLVNGGGLRLLDLGLAYLTGVEAGEAQGLAGTLRYMAPDVLRGGAPNDRSEVYALGTILFRLAAYGRFPRPDSDIAGTLLRGRPDLPAALCGAIAAALETNPALRPAHAAELARALSNALRDGTGNRAAAPRRIIQPLLLWRWTALILGAALLLSLALR